MISGAPEMSTDFGMDPNARASEMNGAAIVVADAVDATLEPPIGSVTAAVMK